MTITIWRELRELTPDLLRCDLTGCGEQASTIHWLPWVNDTCERVVFACPRHDPGGYWIAVERWFGNERDRLREHLAAKHDDRAEDLRPGGLALLEDRLWELQNPVVHDAGGGGVRRQLLDAKLAD